MGWGGVCQYPMQQHLVLSACVSGGGRVLTCPHMTYTRPGISWLRMRVAWIVGNLQAAARGW